MVVGTLVIILGNAVAAASRTAVHRYYVAPVQRGGGGERYGETRDRGRIGEEERGGRQSSFSGVSFLLSVLGGPLIQHAYKAVFIANIPEHSPEGRVEQIFIPQSQNTIAPLASPHHSARFTPRATYPRGLLVSRPRTATFLYSFCSRRARKSLCFPEPVREKYHPPENQPCGNFEPPR